MQPDTRIGRFRAVALIGPDTWQVDGDTGPGIARLMDGRPAPGFDALVTRLVALRHDHLRPVLAAARVDGQVWVVNPATAAGSLAERLRGGQHPPYKIAIDLGVATLRALSAAHDAGFTHGSLDAHAVSFGDGRIQLTGVGYAELVGRAHRPADDLRAMVHLLRTLVPEPPGELRALLASPPPTADAFCRALKTLDPALSHDREFDFTPSGPPESLAAQVTPAPPPAAPTPSTPQGSPNPPPPARMPDAEDSWGVAPDSAVAPAPRPGKGWVIDARDMVEASSKSEEDTWGVDPATAPERLQSATKDGLNRDHTGGVVHRMSSAGRVEESDRKPRDKMVVLAVSVAVITVGLIGARVVMNHLEEPETLPEPTVPAALNVPDPVVDARVKDAVITDGGTVASDGGRATTDGGPTDAAGPGVQLHIEPVAGDVTRVSDGRVICAASTRCRVPIDVDYRVTAKGYLPQDVSGDDLYDRRNIGRLRLVLQAKPPPEPRRKKRRTRRQ